MARKVQTILLDDIDGGDATRTVTFALDGKAYEIDLNDDNLKKLSEALSPFVENGRRISGAAGRRMSSRASSGTNGDASSVRAWAREQGYEVSDRGRVPKEIRSAYDESH